MKENALVIKIGGQTKEKDFVKNPPLPSTGEQFRKDTFLLMKEILDKGVFFIRNDGGAVYKHMKNRTGICFKEIVTGITVNIEKTFLISHFRVALKREVRENLVSSFIEANEGTDNTYVGIRAEEFDRFELDCSGSELQLRGIKGKLNVFVYLDGEWMKPDLFINTKTFYGNQSQPEANVVNQVFRIPESRLKDYFKDLREVAFRYTLRTPVEE